MKKIILTLTFLLLCSNVFGCSDKEYHKIKDDFIGIKMVNGHLYKIIHHSKYPENGKTVEPGELYILENEEGIKYLYNTYKDKPNKLQLFYLKEGERDE